MMSEDSIALSRKQFTRLVGKLAGLNGYPDPDNPLPPGPWDPVIRDILQGHINLAQAGPQPQPWRYMEQVWLSWQQVMLNPQPLPPLENWAVMAATAIVKDIQQTADKMPLLPEEFQLRAVEGIQAKLAQLVDDWCGTGWPRRWPIPIPFPLPPEPEPDPREINVTPLDLIIMGVVFDQLSGTVVDSLQGALQETAVAFQDAGLERME